MRKLRRLRLVFVGAVALSLGFAGLVSGPLSARAGHQATSVLSYTGCLSNPEGGRLYSVQFGDGPASCHAGDPEVHLSGGDISAVIVGAGLSGGGTDGDVTLSVDFAGSGSANTAARSDHDHGVQTSQVYFKGGLTAGVARLTTTRTVVMRLDVPEGQYVDIGFSVAPQWRDSGGTGNLILGAPAGDVTCSLPGVLGPVTRTGTGDINVGGYGSTGFGTVTRTAGQGFELSCLISLPATDPTVVQVALGNAHIRATRVNFTP